MPEGQEAHECSGHLAPAQFQIRLATPADCESLSRLCQALWPESSAEEHARKLAGVLADKRNGTMPAVVLVAETTGGALAGFLEVGLRSHADGCDPKRPVGFLEGWYVAEGHRRKGVGKRLPAAAEDWARLQGCVEMALDTWIDHVTSQRVHETLGFEVVDQCVHYRKALPKNPK
jgi:aminoglycoside 6'-N-acetyltransferase I